MKRFYLIRDEGYQVIVQEEVGGQRWVIPKYIWNDIKETELASEEHKIDCILNKHGRSL